MFWKIFYQNLMWMNFISLEDSTDWYERNVLERCDKIWCIVTVRYISRRWKSLWNNLNIFGKSTCMISINVSSRNPSGSTWMNLLYALGQWKNTMWNPYEISCELQLLFNFSLCFGWNGEKIDDDFEIEEKSSTKKNLTQWGKSN